MKIDITFSDIVRNIYGKLNICIVNIAIEGTVSQIFEKGPGSFSIKYRNKYYPFLS